MTNFYKHHRCPHFAESTHIQLVCSGQFQCKEALQLFVSIYGAEAGNMALRALAMGGVYLGGGIAPKIISALRENTFMKAFLAKGRYKRLLAKMPVRVILNPHTALLGAASVAAGMTL